MVVVDIEGNTSMLVFFTDEDEIADQVLKVFT